MIKKDGAMNKKVLLHQFYALMKSMPDFSTYTPDSVVHAQWMGSAYAMVYQWKPMPAISIADAIEFMPLQSERNKHLERILHVLSHAIADLQAVVGSDKELVFNAEAASQFDDALATLLLTSHETIFVVSPDLNLEAFLSSLIEANHTVRLRLLLEPTSKDKLLKVKETLETDIIKIDIRFTEGIQDQLIFVDEFSGWESKQTASGEKTQSYLMPIDASLAVYKRRQYEELWNDAMKLND
jgi:hypothetical protein